MDKESVIKILEKTIENVKNNHANINIGFLDFTNFPIIKRRIIGVCLYGHPIYEIDECCAMCQCGYGWGSSHSD